MNASTPPAPPSSPRRRLLRLLAAVVSIALVARLGGLGHAEMVHAWHLLGGLAPATVGLVLALQVAWAWSLSRVLAGGVHAVGGRITPAAALRTSMAAFTLSRTVPGGGAAGGLFAARELTRLGHRPGVALAALTTSWAVATTCLAGVLLLGGIAAAWLGVVPWGYVLPAAAVLGALASVGTAVLLALRRPGVHARLVEGVSAVARRVGRRPPAALEDTLVQISGELRDGRHLRRSMCWSVGSWLCDIAAVWLVFAAFGHPLDLTVLVIGYASINLLNSMPELTPGWIGVFEASMAATFAGLGVPAEIALAAVLVYRLVSFWLPVAAGIVPAVRSLAMLRDQEARGATAPVHPRAMAEAAGSAEEAWHDRGLPRADATAGASPADRGGERGRHRGLPRVDATAGVMPGRRAAGDAAGGDGAEAIRDGEQVAA